ncbi:hypothetical protein DFH06DRAFT_1466180 [Mycena polygramma]|nr:hypothetical protein DFH06DRAFT_1466180 [Mycena polygramma]
MPFRRVLATNACTSEMLRRHGSILDLHVLSIFSLLVTGGIRLNYKSPRVQCQITTNFTHLTPQAATFVIAFPALPVVHRLVPPRSQFSSFPHLHIYPSYPRTFTMAIKLRRPEVPTPEALELMLRSKHPAAAWSLLFDSEGDRNLLDAVTLDASCQSRTVGLLNGYKLARGALMSAGCAHP